MPPLDGAWGQTVGGVAVATKMSPPYGGCGRVVPSSQQPRSYWQ
jgi:hypothetical protein